MSDNPTYPGLGPNTMSNVTPARGTAIRPSTPSKKPRGLEDPYDVEEPHFDNPRGKDDLFHSSKTPFTEETHNDFPSGDYGVFSVSKTVKKKLANQSQDRLLFNSDRLIDEAADLMLRVNKQIIGVAFPDQVQLVRMDIRKVEANHAMDGDLEFSYDLVSPAFARRGRATIMLSIREGVFIPPTHVRDSTGKLFEITSEGIKDLLRVSRYVQTIKMYKGPSQRSYVDDR